MTDSCGRSAEGSQNPKPGTQNPDTIEYVYTPIKVCIYSATPHLDMTGLPRTPEPQNPTETPIQMRGGATRSWLWAWRYRYRAAPIPISSSLLKSPQLHRSCQCSLTTLGGAQPITQKFPSLGITRDGVTPRGAFAESQAVFLNPDPDEVAELDGTLKKCNMGLVSSRCIGCISG